MSKNLIIRISNGLGNQLFMYASAYAMSKELSRKLLIDNESSFYSNKNISVYLLNNFNITSEIASDSKKFKSLFGYLKRKFLLKTDLFRKSPTIPTTWAKELQQKILTEYSQDKISEFYNEKFNDVFQL